MNALDACRMIKPTSAVFKIEAAKALADHLNKESREDGDGWTYKVNPQGKTALIDIYDEDGHFVGNL